MRVSILMLTVIILGKKKERSEREILKHHYFPFVCISLMVGEKIISLLNHDERRRWSIMISRLNNKRSSHLNWICCLWLVLLSIFKFFSPLRWISQPLVIISRPVITVIIIIFDDPQAWSIHTHDMFLFCTLLHVFLSSRRRGEVEGYVFQMKTRFEDVSTRIFGSPHVWCFIPSFHSYFSSFPVIIITILKCFEIKTGHHRNILTTPLNIHQRLQDSSMTWRSDPIPGFKFRARKSWWVIYFM